jgi:hypothetical protein
MGIFVYNQSASTMRAIDSIRQKANQLTLDKVALKGELIHNWEAYSPFDDGHSTQVRIYFDDFYIRFRQDYSPNVNESNLRVAPVLKMVDRKTLEKNLKRAEGIIDEIRHTYFKEEMARVIEYNMILDDGRPIER